jgi:hypothetical protein
MPKYALTAVVPSKPDGLACRYLMASPEETDGTRVLIVSVDGKYPDGSLGNAHGHYIASSTMYGLHVFDPDCVVLDFRLLAYRWGNTLMRVFRDISDFMDPGAVTGEPRFPVAVVTSELSRDGFLSLVTPLGTSAPGWHFDDVDAAIAYAVQASKEWLDLNLTD